ncbi:hypothetical protein DND62_31205, partial [Pseudomonas syringae pv. pisi]
GISSCQILEYLFLLFMGQGGRLAFYLVLKPISFLVARKMSIFKTDVTTIDAFEVLEQGLERLILYKS